MKNFEKENYAYTNLHMQNVVWLPIRFKELSSYNMTEARHQKMHLISISQSLYLVHGPLKQAAFILLY